MVTAKDQSVAALFDKRSFILDYYQRDYVWEEPQITRLMNDLSRKFLAQWSDRHSLRDVSSYDPYFLGPYIVCTADGRTSLVDGQQRIITLLLLLIFLKRKAETTPQAHSKAAQLSTLIRTDRFGLQTFRVDVGEYAECFKALLDGRGYNVDDAPQNIKRIWQAYDLIEVHFPVELGGDVLVMFIDWLLFRVSLVVMDAGDRERAEEMFQSINDCGVRLSPMDHLKRFLLSDADPDPRELEGTWTAMVSALENVEKGAAFAYLRTVFRARFPEAAQRPGPSLNDATHVWVRVRADEIWPDPKTDGPARFLTEVLYRFHSLYITLLRARSETNPYVPAVRYNAFHGITEQFDLTFAALRPDDSKEVREQKAGKVAAFLDLFYVTQTLYDERVDQKHVDELVAEVMPAVRLTESVEELGRALGKHAADWPARLERIPELSYGANRRFVHYVLTRLTAWVERGATGGEYDPTDRFLRHRPGERDFEIEHLFTSTASRYAHKEPNARYYGHLRNRIGALLLLDGLDNGSYGGMLLEDKLMMYRKDTRLAGMINPDFFYRGNVKLREFLRFRGLLQMVPTYDSGTALEPFIDARGRFYREMAKRIWSLETLGLAPDSVPGPAATATGKRTHYGVRFQDLVQARFVAPGDRLVGHRRNESFHARVRPDGNLETASAPGAVSPAVAPSLSKAMENAGAGGGNGWSFWQVERTGERLDSVRQRYLNQSGQ
ncbi:DUF262 domain-containing protein [Actinoplanes sp. NPDC051861]|uniref:GmrSD restriction endonuclease domain-containing protein n=1 Tax=Actinoplanes sp. NPDC051861 TaxID=3155170 RepID=UPI0034147B61